MKILRYFSLLLLATSQIVAAQADVLLNSLTGKVDVAQVEAKVKAQSKKRKKKRCCNCAFGTRIICQSMVTPAGLVISEPGEYCLAEDILFAPAANGSSAITIAASNVTLNLNTRRLIQSNTGTSSNIGVSVAAGTTATIIKNGTIENFGAFGIWANSGAAGILVEEINALSCGGNGHAPYATPDCLQLDQISFMAGGIGFGGLSNAPILEFKVIDSIALNTTNPAEMDLGIPIQVVGIGATEFVGAVLENNITGGLFAPAGATRGLFLNAGSTISVENHHSSNLFHFRGGTGVVICAVTSATLTNIYTDNIQDLGGIDLPQRGSVGILIGNSTDVTLEKAEITRTNNTNSLTGVAHGVDVRNSVNTTLKQVTSVNANGAPGIKVAGIALESVSGATKVINCISNGNNGISAIDGDGLVVEPLLSSTGGSPVLETPSSDVVVENSNFENNSRAGVRLLQANNTTVQNSVMVANKHFGILVDSDDEVKPSAIEDNTINGNGTDDGDAGIKDNTSVIGVHNMYINNKAFNNLVKNYDILPAGTPVVSWIVGAALPFGDLNQKFANLDAKAA